MAQRVMKQHAMIIMTGDKIYPPFLKDNGSNSTLMAQYAFSRAKNVWKVVMVRLTSFTSISELSRVLSLQVGTVERLSDLAMLPSIPLTSVESMIPLNEFTSSHQIQSLSKLKPSRVSIEMA